MLYHGLSCYDVFLSSHDYFLCSVVVNPIMSLLGGIPLVDFEERKLFLVRGWGRRVFLFCPHSIRTENIENRAWWFKTNTR